MNAAGVLDFSSTDETFFFSPRKNLKMWKTLIQLNLLKTRNLEIPDVNTWKKNPVSLLSIKISFSIFQSISFLNILSSFWYLYFSSLTFESKKSFKPERRQLHFLKCQNNISWQTQSIFPKHYPSQEFVRNLSHKKNWHFKEEIITCTSG